MKLDKGKYDPDFLVYMIYQGPPADRIRLLSQGSTVGHFNMDDIGWMPVLKPPLEEQRAIVDVIRRRVRKLDSASSTAQHEISLIREYRTRLISDVVTGKVDVRGLALKFTEECAEDNDLTDGIDNDEMLEDDDIELAGEETHAG